MDPANTTPPPPRPNCTCLECLVTLWQTDRPAAMLAAARRQGRSSGSNVR